MVTWSELERRVYLDVGELTWHEIETYTAAVWPLLRRLTSRRAGTSTPGPARRDIAEYRGVQGQAQRPGSSRGRCTAADGSLRTQGCSPARGLPCRADRSSVVAPRHPRSGAAAPPVTVIINEMPPEIRTGKPEPSPPSGGATGRS
jgi:hypothetical protein